jgi:hypothetical protein
LASTSLSIYDVPVALAFWFHALLLETLYVADRLCGAFPCGLCRFLC